MNLGNQNSKYSWRIRDLENPQTGTQFANSVLMYKMISPGEYTDLVWMGVFAIRGCLHDEQPISLEILEKWTHVKRYFCTKWDPFRDFLWQSDPLERHIPIYVLICEYPSPGDKPTEVSVNETCRVCVP